MAQENPWKKQLQANKQNNTVNVNGNVPNTNTNSPINQWKQNQTSTTSLPPWMKKKEQTEPVNPPPWMKKKQQQQKTDNPPPWMKKKQQTSNPSNTNTPAWMKKPGQQTTTTTTNPPPATNSPWKANKFQSPQQKLQRQKKQKQEKLKKQQQEKRLALQKQRQERQKQNQRRQTEQMTREQSLSNQYEEFMKRQQIRILQEKKKRQAQEQQNLQNLQRLQKQKQSKKSAKKQSRSNKKERDQYQCESLTIFHKYLHYFNLSVSKVDQYRMKLQSQKDLIELVKNFSQSLIEIVKKLVTDRKIYQKKRKIISLAQMQILYAFCEGKKQKQTIFFDFNDMVKFQKCFQFYSDLQDIIISLCKKMGNFKIRAPLMVLIKYKGISFLCQALSEELTDLIASEAKDYKQISNQLNQLQKQLKQGGYPLTKQDLQIKKITLNDSQQYIVYIKNSEINKLTNNKNEISKLTDYYSLTLKNFNYLLTESNLEHFKKMETPYFNHYTEIAHLAQCINTVYQSCQGEVQQTSFWKLVLQKNEQIWSLIKNAGYKGQLIRQNILFVYFEYLSGLRIQFRKGMFQKFKVHLKEIKCKISQYQFKKFQLVQIQNNFEKYLRQNKTELVEQSLKISDIIERSSSNNNMINLIKKKGKYLINQKKFRQAVQFYKDQIKKLKKYDLSLIQLKIELLAIYIQRDREEDILKTLTSLMEILQFFYCQETLLHSSLYQMMGTYYSRKQDKNTQVIKFFQHSLDIVIRIFGDQKYQVGQIYLSRAAAFINLRKFDLFTKDIQHALKIFKSSSKYSAKIAQCYFYMGKVKILQKQINQGVQLIDQATSIYMKIQNYVQAVNVWLMVLEIVKQDKKYEEIAQKIIYTSLTYKNPYFFTKIITRVLAKLARQHSGQSILEQILMQKNTHHYLQESSSLLSLNEIQAVIKNFSNFFQMLRWSFTILNSRKSDTSQYQKARDIIQLIAQFYHQQAENEANQYPQQNLDSLQNQDSQEHSQSIQRQKQNRRKNQNQESISESQFIVSEANFKE